MHELGVVFHIADDVMQIAKDNGASHIEKVTLEIGEVTTIVPYYLIDCWKWNANRYEILKDSVLDVITIKATTYCENCSNIYETIKYGKICPKCNSDKTYLKTGNEVIIKEILVKEE